MSTPHTDGPGDAAQPGGAPRDGAVGDGSSGGTSPDATPDGTSPGASPSDTSAGGSTASGGATTGATSGGDATPGDTTPPGGHGAPGTDRPGEATAAGTGTADGTADDTSTAGGTDTDTATGPVFGTDGERWERWDCAGPAEIEVTIGPGRVEIDLTGPADEVRVQVRAEPGLGGWSSGMGGLGGLLEWLGTMSRGGMPHGAGASGRGFDPIVGAPWERSGDPSAAAVEATSVSWSEPARRLVVRGPEASGLDSVPLVVTVTAPAGSRLATRTGSADVQVRGTARWAAVRTGSGSARLDEVDGDVDVTTGSGAIDIGAVTGRARLRAGSGTVDVGTLGGASEVRTGSGDVRVGEIAADLEVRTGSGDVVLADAVSGAVRVTSGSGGLRAGVHSGVAAELDLSSGSGRLRSDLEVGAVAPESPSALRISGRTGSGDVLVTRATPVPA